VPPENHIQLANLNFQTGSFLGFGSSSNIRVARSTSREHLRGEQGLCCSSRKGDEKPPALVAIRDFDNIVFGEGLAEAQER